MGDNIMTYNGSAVLAMTGKNCVAIASDLRFGAQFMMIARDLEKVFRMHDSLYVGFGGLTTDAQTFHQKLVMRLKMYKLRENRDISPKAFSHLVHTMLYEKRFGPYFVEPVIAGLDSKGEPFINAMDVIGAGCEATDFVVAGTATENLQGICESLYRPNLEPEELFETVSQCLLSGINRDAYSGWGAVVHVITTEGVTTRYLKTKQD